ncbi:hypothetical protein M1D93_15385 [Arthrobacter sp. Z1-9]
MFTIGNRTELPLAATAGWSCCPPAAPAPEVADAVERPDAGTPSPTPHHFSH